MRTAFDSEKYKLGVPEWCLPGDSIFSMKMAAALGMDGVQIEAGFYETGFKLGHPWVRSLYREAAEQYGVELISIVMNDLNVHGLRNGRGTAFGDIAYEGLDIALEASAALGVPVLMIPSFVDNDMRTERDIENTVEALRYACDEAAQSGTIIATETAISSAQLKRLLGLVNRENLKLFYDSQNYRCFRGYDPMEHLPIVYPYMVNQLHVKDGLGEAYSSKCLGEGDSRFEEQIRFLREQDYRGWFVFENYYTKLPLRGEAKDPIDLFRKDIAKLRYELTKD